jgi:cation diffusion facilitator CzcD-associated flavoprotein CzcO
MATFERAAAVPVGPAGGSVQLAFHALLRARVPEADLRRRLRPTHPVGVRRALVSSDYHRTLRRPHVDLVTEPIAELVADGVRTADGVLHPADVVVLATGFETTRFVAPMKVFGRDGRELSEQWRDGARAHLGITVPGFPNLFLMHGPNTALRSGSVVHMIECQAGYVRQAVRRIAEGARTLEVRRAVADAFDAEVQERLGGRSFSPGVGQRRSVNDWPGTMREYERRTAHLDETDYFTT